MKGFRMIKTRFWLVAFWSALGVCVSFSVSLAGQEKPTFTPPNHCLFPLEQGARWKYSIVSPEFSATSTWSIDTMSGAPGAKTAILSKLISMAGMNNQTKSELSLRQNRVIEKLVDIGPAQSMVDAEAAGMLLPDLARLNRGYAWEVDLSAKVNFGIVEGQAATRMFCRLGWEWVTVPAGTFYALKLLYRFSRLRGDIVLKVPPKDITLDKSMPGDYFEWYAPFVGLVKSQDTAPDGGGTWELLSCTLVPDPCDTAVISLTGTAKVNGRPPEAEIIHGQTVDVETGENSTLELYEANRALMRIGSSTTLRRSSRCSSKKEPEPVLKSVTLFLGRLYLILNQAFGKQEFRCDTPSAVVGVRGTKLMLEVRADGSTLIEVEEGEVEVTGKKTGEVVVLKKGERREFISSR